MKLLNEAVVIGKKAVIADLHFGLVPFYDRELLERTLKLAESFQTLIIAGDFRHLGKKSPVHEFIKRISETVELVIVRGNHDIGIQGYKALKLGNYVIFHGHAKIDENLMNAKIFIFAHAHPSVFIPSEVGGHKERAFLIGKIDFCGERKRVVVLPAFNELCSSTAVNLEKPAGFMFRRFDYLNWDAVLVDGTVLNLRTISKK
ncbi:MAG: metallophosphoesterase [Archaeoglobaceae archaeon]